ncbi:MAG TPA: phage protein Gp36 family protein [Phycisphaerae bacterium]|nr:phage protein Gp36 family protein [Phycisphaerae bacterium]
MAYCTKADLEDRSSAELVIALADADNDGVLNAADLRRIAAAILAADTVIDFKLGRRYTVPFTIVPAIVKEWSCSIALFKLAEQRGLAGVPEWRVYQERNNEARQMLESIADNEADLPGVSASASDIWSSTADVEPAISASRFEKGTGSEIDDYNGEELGTLDQF